MLRMLRLLRSLKLLRVERGKTEGRPRVTSLVTEQTQ